MNINKIVKDSVNGIKKTYNDTQSSFFKALGNVKQEDMNNVAKVGKLIESSMKKALK